MDELLAQLKAQGLSVEEAIEHIKLMKQAKEAADQNLDNVEKLVDAAIDVRIRAMTEKRMSEFSKVESDADAAPSPQLMADMWLLGHIIQRPPKSFDPDKVRQGYLMHQHKDVPLPAIQKALDTVDMSVVVPTALAANLMSDIEKSVVMDNFQSFTLPTNPYEMPYQSGSMTLYGVDESTSDSAPSVVASDLATAKLTFTARKMGALTRWSQELDEDSAIAMLPLIREDFVRIMRDGWERAFLMGDERTTTSNINVYGATPVTTAGGKDYWLQVDGLVKNALVTNSAQSSAIGKAIEQTSFNTIRKLMGKYGDRTGDLVILLTRDLYYDVMALDNVRTLDKYGPAATILTGELAKIDGIPLMITDGLPLTAAGGYVDGVTPSNNVKKSFLIVNKSYGPLIGRRGELRIAIDKINKTDQYEGVIFSRYDIQVRRAKALAYGYNLA
jgi:HK97 family phage major capsid protein